MMDVFVHDRFNRTTTRVNVSSSGEQAQCVSLSDPEDCRSYIRAISADGRYVAFYSTAKNLVAGDTWDAYDAMDDFVRDRLSGTTTHVDVNSAGVKGSGSSSIGGFSADGRYVAFGSNSSNLVTGDTNNVSDVFVRDRLLNTTYIADLQATVTAKPVSVKKGQTASYTLTVKNNGPDSANNVALTDIVSNGTVLSITPSQGTCSKGAISVCRLGTLA